MSGFAREHLRPLLGSAGLHLALIALLAGAALHWTAEQPPAQLAIEGVVVDPGVLARSSRAGKPRAEPAPAPEPPTQVQPAPEPDPVVETPRPPPEPAKPAPDEVAARERAAEEAAAAKQKAQAEERARVEAEALERRKAAEEAALAKAEAAKRKQAEEDAQRKAAEAEAKQKKEAEARAAADAKAQAAREAELRRQLEAEEEGDAAFARSGVVDEYRALLAQTIQRNWIRPPSARAGLECRLFVTQAQGGTVLDVRLGACNGDQAVRESIVNAVYRSSPLPPPRDPRAFDRRLEIVFKPTE